MGTPLEGPPSNLTDWNLAICDGSHIFDRSPVLPVQSQKSKGEGQTCISRRCYALASGGAVPEPYYITTPIYYVNDMPHIGHIYTTVMTDLFARYHRLRGFKVHFLTGTDEHGQKIARSARDQGIQPIELANRVVERYHQLWRDLSISHDDFIRTTEPRQQRGVWEIIDRINAAGDIYKGG